MAGKAFHSGLRLSTWLEPASQPAGASPDVRQLTESHLPLVLSEAEKIFLAPGIGLERDDLISSGALGLLRAAKRFEPQRGVTFGVFARSYVRGAMLDEIRKVIRHDPEARVFPQPSNQVDPDALAAITAEPDFLMTRRIRKHMEQVLNQDERTKLSLYYYEDLTLREIAEITGEPLSTVARSLTRAVAKLKQALTGEDKRAQPGENKE
ncbi:MAG: sigma-70 family RNA polymerase sigma factor [Candidatus Binataceae bacterium]